MKYYLAPMEGLTGYVYRNAHRELFGGADRYFTPFITPNSNRSLTSREMRDVQAEHNRFGDVVPQIMANDAAAFLWACDKLERLGYGEVNLNLGCPSRTVVSKGRGSGFLGKPTELDEFLAQVFDGACIRISVKARVGLTTSAEISGLMAIFNRYPLSEVIIHARVQSAYYSGAPDLEAYRRALALANMPVAYNGDIFSPADAQALIARFPGTCALMLGRGVMTDPALLRSMRGGAPLGAGELTAFHDRLLEGYLEALGDPVTALFRMKELWSYMSALAPGCERTLKRLNKARRLDEYRAAAGELLSAIDAELAARAGERAQRE